MKISSNDYSLSKLGDSLISLRKKTSELYITRVCNPKLLYSHIVMKYIVNGQKRIVQSVDFDDIYFSKISTDNYIKVTDDVLDYIVDESQKIKEIVYEEFKRFETKTERK